VRTCAVRQALRGVCQEPAQKRQTGPHVRWGLDNRYQATRHCALCGESEISSAARASSYGAVLADAGLPTPAYVQLVGGGVQ